MPSPAIVAACVRGDGTLKGHLSGDRLFSRVNREGAKNEDNVEWDM